MLDWTRCPAVVRVAGKVSGAWVSKATRVPVRALFENLEDGATVNDFLTLFPGVTREQVETVLEQASSFQELIQFRSKLREEGQAGRIIGKKENSLNPAQVVEYLHRVKPGELRHNLSE